MLLDANARFDLKDATVRSLLALLGPKYNTDAVAAQGRTALDYAKLSYDDWPLFKKLFEESSPDGRTYLVSNDLVTGTRFTRFTCCTGTKGPILTGKYCELVTATYLGDRGTKFEHPNLWEMVSGFGVRCTQVCVYVSMHVRMYMRIFIHTCIHTHTHTDRQTYIYT